MGSQDGKLPTVAADQDAAERLQQQLVKESGLSEEAVDHDSSGTFTAADAAAADAATSASSSGGVSSPAGVHATGPPDSTGIPATQPNQQTDNGAPPEAAAVVDSAQSARTVAGVPSELGEPRFLQQSFEEAGDQQSQPNAPPLDEGTVQPQAQQLQEQSEGQEEVVSSPLQQQAQGDDQGPSLAQQQQVQQQAGTLDQHPVAPQQQQQQAGQQGEVQGLGPAAIQQQLLQVQAVDHAPFSPLQQQAQGDDWDPVAPQLDPIAALAQAHDQGLVAAQQHEQQEAGVQNQGPDVPQPHAGVALAHGQDQAPAAAQQQQMQQQAGAPNPGPVEPQPQQQMHYQAMGQGPLPVTPQQQLAVGQDQGAIAPQQQQVQQQAGGFGLGPDAAQQLLQQHLQQHGANNQVPAPPQQQHVHHQAAVAALHRQEGDMQDEDMQDEEWQRQAVQRLQAVLRRREANPQDPHLQRLVAELQDEIIALGDNVDIDQLGMGAMDRQPRHFHQQQVPPAAQEGVNPAGAAPYGSPSGGAQGPPTPVQRCEQAPPAQRQQEPQPLAAQDAYPSHQKPGSPNRGAKRPRQEVADAADSQNKRRLVQQQGRSREHEEKQALEQQLAQHPPAAAHAQAGGQGPVAPQPQQVQQQAGVGALHEQDVDMQVADGAQQTEVQQQVMQTLLQLAGETNQDDYEAQWDEKQAKQWMRGAQQMLQVFPQSAFLVALVQRLREELSAWGDGVGFDQL